MLLAASTEKLAIITGGEYRGKDDPVLLAVEPVANGLNLFMRDRFYMTQGDGRGSHNMFPIPLACFLAIFVRSLYLLLVRRRVVWKGREIRPSA